MSKLQPRHKRALITAYTNAVNYGADLQARYLREALAKLGFDVLTATSEQGATEKPRINGGATGQAAFIRKLVPSAALACIVGDQPLTRVDVVSQLWAYIKKHKLQDQQNRRMVNCDDKMYAIFQRKQVSMFEMAGLIGKHLDQ